MGDGQRDHQHGGERERDVASHRAGEGGVVDAAARRRRTRGRRGRTRCRSGVRSSIDTGCAPERARNTTTGADRTVARTVHTVHRPSLAAGHVGAARRVASSTSAVTPARSKATSAASTASPAVISRHVLEPAGADGHDGHDRRQRRTGPARSRRISRAGRGRAGGAGTPRARRVRRAARRRRGARATRVERLRDDVEGALLEHLDHVAVAVAGERGDHDDGRRGGVVERRRARPSRRAPASSCRAARRSGRLRVERWRAPPRRRRPRRWCGPRPRARAAAAAGCRGRRRRRGWWTRAAL